MEKILHRAGSRGHADHGWLKTFHSFSFADYYDPGKIRFGMLRVLNDDTVAPGMGFGTHPHDNMEIVTIPLKGEIAHKDSTGNKEVIKPGEVQIMSAGSGLTHSEFNNSNKDELSFLQIWVFPKIKNIEPRYDQRKLSIDEMRNSFKTIVSPDKDSDALWINQNSYFSLGEFEKGINTVYKIKSKGNGAYIFVIDGKVKVQDEILNRRDAIGISDADEINLESLDASKILIIEVPMN